MKVKKEKQKSVSRDMIDELVIDLNAKDQSLQALMEKQKRYDNVKDESKTINEGFTSISKGNFITGALLGASKNDMLGPVETNRGWALIQVKDISPIDSTEYEVQKETLRSSMLTRKQSQNLQTWLNDLKDNAEIIDNRNYFY
jgi:Lhr-like helicase